MAVFQLLAIQSPTALGQVTYSHSLGVTPKAVLAWTQGVGSSDTVFYDAAISVGWADGTSQYSVSAISQDGTKPTRSFRVVSSYLIGLVASSTSWSLRATLVSWDASGITLNWTSTLSTPRPIHLLLIGGDDVSAKALQFLSPTSTGTQSITGVGFQPECLLFGNCGTAGQTLDSIMAHAVLGIGAAESSSGNNMGSSWASEDGLNKADTYRFQDSHAILAPNLAGGIFFRAYVSSYNADGFNLTWLNVDSASRPVIALALRGLQFRVGTLTAPTASGPQEVVIGLQPECLLLGTYWTGSSTSSQAHAYQSLGVATGPTNQRSTNLYSQDDVIPAVAKCYTASNRVLVEHTTAVSRTASLSSFDPYGFTLNWDASGTASQVWYLAIASLSGDRSISGSDTGAVGGAESPSLQASLSATDQSLLSAQEAPQVSPSRGDTGTVLADEQAQTTLSVSGSDTGTVGGAESWGLTAQVPSGENGLLGSSESAQVSSPDLGVSASDAGAVSASEASSARIVPSDTGQLLGQESWGITVTVSEVGLLSGAEQTSTAPSATEDDHVVTAAEGALLQVPLQASDGGLVGSTEAGDIAVGVDRYDDGPISAAEDSTFTTWSWDGGTLTGLEFTSARPQEVLARAPLVELQARSPLVELSGYRVEVETRPVQVLLTLEEQR